jgi:hypothetical protein
MLPASAVDCVDPESSTIHKANPPTPTALATQPPSCEVDTGHGGTSSASDGERVVRSDALRCHYKSDSNDFHSYRPKQCTAEDEGSPSTSP